MNVQPSCCLDVVVYMLNCVFWRHILLEIEFKSRVDMGSESQIAFGYCTAVSPMSGSPTFDTGKKKQKRGEFKTPPYPTGRRSNYFGQNTPTHKLLNSRQFSFTFILVRQRTYNTNRLKYCVCTQIVC